MTAPVLDRFWAKVEKSAGCWEWTAARSEGYGIFDGAPTTRMAHRIACEALVGPIPDGLHIDHLCRNTGCVNPAHLEPVTPRVNTLRGIGPSAMNAKKVQCPAGHPYTPENTYVSGTKRRCRKCNAASVQRYKKSKRAAAAAEEARP